MAEAASGPERAEIRINYGTVKELAVFQEHYDRLTREIQQARVQLSSSPPLTGDSARARQRYVLNRMAEDSIITGEEARAAYEQGMPLAGNWRRSLNGYFALYIRSQLLTVYKEADLHEKGLSVATTVDGRIQEEAARAAM